MIVAALKKQTAASEIKRIFLVGGFSKSQYLCRKLMAEMAKEGRQITVVDDSTAKPPAEGGVGYGTQETESVVGRACRFSYGTDVGLIHDPGDKQHEGRRIRRWADGLDYVHDGWSAVVAKNQIIQPNEGVSSAYIKYYRTGNPKLRVFSVPLYAFTLDQNAPQFMRDPDGRFHGLASPRLRQGFVKVCDLSADLSGMSGGLERQRGPAGAYWVLNFSIGIEFGGVELQAYIEWVEKGIKKRGGVSILPSQD